MAVLFIGNGLNLAESLCPSWSDLLFEVGKKSGVPYKNNLSMTLGFESFEASAMKADKRLNESTIKKLIASSVVLKENPGKKSLHSVAVSVGTNRILTTNYDYALEKALDPAFVPKKNTTERIYSRFRYQKAGETMIYHIHGEKTYPESLCLGFEQYAGSLEKYRTLLTKSTTDKNGTDGKSFQLADVLNGLTVPEPDSWLYDFFREDIYILGFSLDKSEMDIWWLLAYRSKLMREKKLHIQNHIVFYDTDERKNKSCTETIVERNDVLRSFNVDVVSLIKGGFKQKYIQALEEIKTRVNKGA